MPAVINRRDCSFIVGAFMDNNTRRILEPGGGASQIGMRAHNERLVLSMIQRYKSLSKTQIAHRSGLSIQTASVIMRNLEADGLLERGEPVRGRVGQPSVPMKLKADGAFSIGLKIGRRSADLVLMDFIGQVTRQLHQPYAYPVPDAIMDFLRTGLAELNTHIPAGSQHRNIGIGIAEPFELWNWLDAVGGPKDKMQAWKDFDLAKAIGQFTDLPVYIENDATAACRAEHIFGRGPEFADYAYFFVGSFIGGGIVLNHSVHTGRTGNAGAFGTLPVSCAKQSGRQLIDNASIFLLEHVLTRHDIDPSPLWLQPDNWQGFGKYLDEWIDTTANALASASIAVCSVIDFEAVIIDGGFPADVRTKIVAQTRKYVDAMDSTGIETPTILQGMVGNNARVLGAASRPLFSRYLLDRTVLFRDNAPQRKAETL